MQSRVWGGDSGQKDERNAENLAGKEDGFNWMGKGLGMLDYASNLLESVDQHAKVKLVDDDDERSALERRRLKHQEGLNPTQAAASPTLQSCYPNEEQIGPQKHENSVFIVTQPPPSESTSKHYDEAAQLSLELESAEERLSAQETELRLSAARLDSQLEKVATLEEALQKALKAAEEMDAKRVEAEKRVGEMTVTANGLNEELNTKNKMDLTSVIELERNLERVRDARAEDGKHLRQVQARLAELESSNASLNEQLANKNRELDVANIEIKKLADACASLEDLSSAAALPHHGLTGHNGGAVTCEEAEEQLALLKAKEIEDASKVERAEKDIIRLRHDLTVARLSCDNKSKAVRAAEIQAEQSEKALLEKSMAESTTVTPLHPPPSQDMQDKLIRELREQMMEKQSLLDGVLSDKSAFQARLNSATARMHKMEGRLHEMGDDGFVMPDIEDGGNEMLPESINSIGGGETRNLLHYRGALRQPVGANGRHRPLQRSILASNQSVMRVVNTLDRASLTAGRFLRSVPLARLCFILYLFLLHIWVCGLFITLFHSTYFVDENGTKADVLMTHLPLVKNKTLSQIPRPEADR